MKIQINLNFETIPIRYIEANMSSLKSDLDSLNIDTKNIDKEEFGDNTKGISPDIMALILGFVFSPIVFKQIVEILKIWNSRSQCKGVKIQIGDKLLEVSGISKERQNELIDIFISELSKDDYLELKQLEKIEIKNEGKI